MVVILFILFGNNIPYHLVRNVLAATDVYSFCHPDSGILGSGVSVGHLRAGPNCRWRRGLAGAVGGDRRAARAIKWDTRLWRAPVAVACEVRSVLVSFPRCRPRRLPVCGAALRPGERVVSRYPRPGHGRTCLTDGLKGAAWGRGRARVGTGVSLEGADAGTFGTMPFARFVALGMPGRAFLCLALAGLRHFCCSHRGSCPPSSRF